MSLSALAFSAPAPGVHDVPDWIHLCPAGPLVTGRDGRAFRVEDAEAAIEATELPMALDLDHESMSYAGSTKAYGWVDRIVYHAADSEGRAPGFWGHVETWTTEGRRLVGEREFRGLSPVVRVQYDEDDEDLPPRLVGFLNAALTNRPNLTMTLLNSQQTHPDAELVRLRAELHQTRALLHELRPTGAAKGTPTMFTDVAGIMKPERYMRGGGENHTLALSRRADHLLSQGHGLTTEERHTAAEMGVPEKFVLMAKLEGL